MSLLASDPADGLAGVVRDRCAGHLCRPPPAQRFPIGQKQKKTWCKNTGPVACGGQPRPVPHPGLRILNSRPPPLAHPPVQAAGHKRPGLCPVPEKSVGCAGQHRPAPDPQTASPGCAGAECGSDRHGAPPAPIKVASAPDTPAAIIGLASFGSLWLRALFQTHFWSLRGQETTTPLQTGAPAEHGPLYPTLPGPACQPEVTRLPVPRYAPAAQVAGASAEILTLELTRTPAQGSDPARHLLMIRGPAHGATVFQHRHHRRAQQAAAFLAQGYTVWLLDHRLSNRLGYAKQQHSMDDLAQLDIPAAVAHVYPRCGPTHPVFAHCGAQVPSPWPPCAAGCKRAQAKSRVRAAIIHAVHPWVVPRCPTSSLASWPRSTATGCLPIWPSTPCPRASLRPSTSSLTAWPPACPGRKPNRPPTCPCDRPEGGTATCNRMTLFYGREWVHANLADATHRKLATLVGPASVEVFRQLYYIVTRQRLTDREGAGVYMTRANFQAHWPFPVLFAHGTENRVFDPRSAVRSWLQLSRLQAAHPDSARRTVSLFMPHGYGHMDFLFGKDAHRDVSRRWSASWTIRPGLTAPGACAAPRPMSATNSFPATGKTTRPACSASH